MPNRDHSQKPVPSRFSATDKTGIQAHPIRVAHLIHTMAHGGVETALVNWFLTFDPNKVEAHLLCFANPGGTERPFIEAAARAGLRVDTITWGRHKPIWRAARETTAWIQKQGIELLHCHNTYANLVGLLAARGTGVRTLTTIYVWSGYGIKRRILQWVDERLLNYFDQVTAHCESARDATIKRGIKAERIRLLTCGFADRVAEMDGSTRAVRRAAMGIGPDDTVLIKVARFWPEKRHDVLMRAFQLLLRRNTNIRLWIPGVGPEEPRIKELAIALGVSDRCDFLGFRTDLPELLAMADIQVHSSDEEGVPLAILSGMAAGKPIVSTGVGGIPEVIEDGISGVLVAPGSPETFADAVYALMLNSPYQQALGHRAQRFIKTEYSLAAATARVEQLYAEVVGR